MKGDLSRKANEYAEEATNRELYPEPILGQSPGVEGYEKQRKWMAHYCQKRIEFFALSGRVFSEGG